jgi:hypothetical protein
MNTTLLIGTCDSYQFLWKNLTTLTDKYLPFSEKIVSCESQIFPYHGYKSVTCSSPNWGERIIATLNEVKTDFVFFILDDYYFTKKFDQQFFSNIETLLNCTEYNKYCLDCSKYSNYRLIPFNKNIYLHHQSSEYLTTLQPSVWRVEYLKQILKPNYSPWDFELVGTEENKHYNNKCFMELYSDSFYFNAARKGKIISPGWQELKEKEKLDEFCL